VSREGWWSTGRGGIGRGYRGVKQWGMKQIWKEGSGGLDGERGENLCNLFRIIK